MSFNNSTHCNFSLCYVKHLFQNQSDISLSLNFETKMPMLKFVSRHFSTFIENVYNKNAGNNYSHQCGLWEQ